MIDRLKRAARFDLVEKNRTRMFSTYEGAKRQAKSLHATLERCWMVFPLNKCQHALARAQGYASWHELRTSIDDLGCNLEPALFERRLVNSVPEPCSHIIPYWCRNERFPWEDMVVENTLPEFISWYHTVREYHWSLSVGLEHNTPLLGRGSGKGQKLRKSIVYGALMHSLAYRDDERDYFRLNPETLAVEMSGYFQSFFIEVFQHKDFYREYDQLSAAGVITWETEPASASELERSRGKLRVTPTNPSDILAHVIECRRLKRE